MPFSELDVLKKTSLKPLVLKKVFIILIFFFFLFNFKMQAFENFFAFLSRPVSRTVRSLTQIGHFSGSSNLVEDRKLRSTGLLYKALKSGWADWQEMFGGLS